MDQVICELGRGLHELDNPPPNDDRPGDLWAFHRGKPCKRPRRMDDTYTVTRQQLIDLVNMTVDKCRSDWHWGEGLDSGVLWLKIDRDILGLSD